MTRMKNKYLTRSLCITILSAMVLTGPLSVLAEEDSDKIETVSEVGDGSSAGEPVSTPVPEAPAPETPAAEPEGPKPQPTTAPTPEAPMPEPTAAPDTPTPEPTITPETPTPEPTPTPEQPTPTITPMPTITEPSEAVKSLIEKIKALSDVELTAADAEKVAELRAEYEKLPEDQKTFVTNYQQLVEFENTIKEIEDSADEIEVEPDEEDQEQQENPEDKTEDAAEDVEFSDQSDSISDVGKMGTPVYYVSNLHAGKEFYLDSLKSNYQITFSDDFASVMDEIEKEYKTQNGLTDASDSRDNGLTSSSDSLLVRNWQDILSVYIYEQEQKGITEFKLDSSCKEEFARIFAEMNPIIRDETNVEHVSYGNYHINYYIKKHDISQKDRDTLKKYVETDCKLLCAIVTDARGFVRQSVGDDVSEERVNVITAAYSLVGEVGYFWGGKSTQIGHDSSWGSAAKVEAAGSASTGTVRAFGLDCSGFVTWSVINGYLNQGMQSDVGDGTSEQWENARVVSENDAQPGDFVFQSGPEAGSDNHVGIICGQTDDGDWIAVHCSSGKNGVTVGEAYGASFRYIRQPSFYPTQDEVIQMESEGAAASNVTEEVVIESTVPEVSGEITISDILSDNVTLDTGIESVDITEEDTEEVDFADDMEVVFEDEEETVDVSADLTDGIEATDTLQEILNQNISASEHELIVFPQKVEEEAVEIIFED